MQFGHFHQLCLNQKRDISHGSTKIKIVQLEAATFSSNNSLNRGKPFLHVVVMVPVDAVLFPDQFPVTVLKSYFCFFASV